MYFYYEQIKTILARFQAAYKKSNYQMRFYTQRIKPFFINYMGQPENERRTIDSINSNDIDQYLMGLKKKASEIVNIYSALKSFFIFTYMEGISNEIVLKATKPSKPLKPIIILSSLKQCTLCSFITNRTENINDRLILALFLFTGLSRHYVANIKKNQFVEVGGSYKLKIKKSTMLPMKPELLIVVKEYLEVNSSTNKYSRISSIAENSLSNHVSTLLKRVLNCHCSPSILTNTYVFRGLADDIPVQNLAKLTLKHPSVILKFINPRTEIIEL